MKRYIIAVVFAIIVANPTYAYIFPNNSKTAYLDITSGTGGELLPSITNHDRTLIYATIRAVPSVDCKILVDGNQYLSALGNTSVEVFAPVKIPIGQNVNYTKTSNKECIMRIVYTDYDLTLVPDNIVALSSVSMPIHIASTSHDLPLTASSSIMVYNTMTAGDMITVLMLFGVISLLLLKIWFTKV